MKIAFAMLVLAVSTMSISPGAPAHHGDAGYDITKLVTVKGTVTEFHFQNPNIEIFIDVKKDDQIEKLVNSTAQILCREWWAGTGKHSSLETKSSS